MIATSTDYDAWRVGEAPVTVAEVFKTLSENADLSRRVAGAILEHVNAAILKKDVLTSAEGGMKFSIMTRKELQSEEDKKTLGYILPAYFE